MASKHPIIFVRKGEGDRTEISRDVGYSNRSADGGNVTVTTGGKQNNTGKADIDWSRLAMTGGGGLLGYALAASIADGLKKPGKKQSTWERLLATLMPVAAGGLGAWTAHRLGGYLDGKASEKKAQVSVPEDVDTKMVNGVPYYRAARGASGKSQYVPSNQLELLQKINDWGFRNNLGGNVPFGQVAGEYSDRQNLYGNIALGGSGVAGTAAASWPLWYLYRAAKGKGKESAKSELLHSKDSVDLATRIADMSANASTPEAIEAATRENVALRKAIDEGNVLPADAIRQQNSVVEGLTSQIQEAQLELKRAIRSRDVAARTRAQAKIADLGDRIRMARRSAGRRIPITNEQISQYKDRIAKNDKIIANKKPDQPLVDQANRTMIESMAGKRKTFGRWKDLVKGLGVPLIAGLGSAGLGYLSNMFGEEASRGQELEDLINAANK